MTNRRGAVTAAELAAELESNPDWVRDRDAREAERQERDRWLRESQKPIVADLRAVGVQVDSVWDLDYTSDPYPAALPVLMEHLERGGYPERVMEGLGGALAVKPAVAFWDRLKARWLDARDSGEEDGTAVALAACATKNQLDDLIDFLSVEERHESRLFFIRPIMRVGGERAYEVLESVRDDPVLGQEATARLKRRRK